jgi:uncharacterized protein (DUF1499 family)
MKKWLKRISVVLALLLATAGAFITVEILSGHSMGLFTGARPKDLGFKDGLFKACSWKPNCVSSTADKADATHYIAPFKFSEDLGGDWRKVREHLANIRNARIVLEHPGYVHVEFKSEVMGFVDDVEFAIDHKNSVVHVRSSSRLGIRDFGVNRKRIEAIRTQLASK